MLLIVEHGKTVFDFKVEHTRFSLVARSSLDLLPIHTFSACLYIYYINILFQALLSDISNRACAFCVRYRRHEPIRQFVYADDGHRRIYLLLTNWLVEHLYKPNCARQICNRTYFK